jgi:acetyl esterase/lipase
MLLGCVLLLACTAAAPAGDPPPKRQQDVIYGRKYGTALTLDVFRPAGKANGAGIILVVSGGWFSAHEAVNPGYASAFTKRGYTVFAVVHGSQPKYAINEIVQDLHRAVRFIRHHARDYGIDPDRLGITGGSAGGHLSLMQGTAGREGDPKAKDPVERESSRVQAVACFFPPTDFLNWGEKGKLVMGSMPDPIKPAFAFQDRDPKTGGFVPVTDEAKVKTLLRALSPITHVSAGTAPALIVHGDKDTLVPIQQAEVMIARLKEAGIPAELVVKPGAAHGWKGMDKDLNTFMDWFDRHLLKKAPADAPPRQGQAKPASDLPASRSGPLRELSQVGEGRPVPRPPHQVADQLDGAELGVGHVQARRVRQEVERGPLRYRPLDRQTQRAQEPL